MARPTRQDRAASRPASRWSRWQRAILDLLFPPRCLGCRAWGAWLCPTCRAGLPRLAPERCPGCGRSASPGPAGRPTGAFCAACRPEHPALAGVCAGYVFEGVLRAGIHQLKYRRARHLAEPLAELLLATLAAAAPPVEAVAPVPLHAARLAQRGYNQSALLAAELAAAAGLPLVGGSLRRVRPTEPQVRLSAAQRRANVAGAFAVVGPAPELVGRRVLLVDDVCTTGSTLEACAVALRAAGCREVWGLVLAAGK